MTCESAVQCACTLAYSKLSPLIGPRASHISRIYIYLYLYIDNNLSVSVASASNAAPQSIPFTPPFPYLLIWLCDLQLIWNLFIIIPLIYDYYYLTRTFQFAATLVHMLQLQRPRENVCVFFFLCLAAKEPNDTHTQEQTIRLLTDDVMTACIMCIAVFRVFFFFFFFFSALQSLYIHLWMRT